MQKIIVVGDLGRDVPILNKNAPTLGTSAVSDSPPPDAKTISTLAAKFAIGGREPHVITKAGRRHFEVRHLGGSYTCSSEADLHGLLAGSKCTPLGESQRASTQ